MTGAKIHDIEPEDSNLQVRKRKLFKKDTSGNEPKKRVTSSYFIPELAHILALCQDRVPFVLLVKELNKRMISYSDIEVDGENIGLSLTVLGLLSTEGLEEETVARLRRNVLSCKLRQLCKRGTKAQWMCEVCAHFVLHT